ncbi:MAG: LysR substrate-binding domain-containing protein [Rhodoblastus sp.]
MDLRQLRYFAQIVESGSLSKASRCLFIAQPALSQQIAKLEDEVGKPLLQRSSRGVTPTENGLALYHHALFVLRQMDQALSIARQDAGAVQGMVSVGLPATTVLAIGLPLMKAIRAQYPGILLNVVEGMSGHIAQMMRLGQLDLAILFSNDVSSKLDATALLEEELFVLFPESSPYAPPDRADMTVAEVAELPLILPTSTHGLRRRVVAEFERRDLKPHVVAEIELAFASDELRLRRRRRDDQTDVRPSARGRARQALARALDFRRAHHAPQLSAFHLGELALAGGFGRCARDSGYGRAARHLRRVARRAAGGGGRAETA